MALSELLTAIQADADAERAERLRRAEREAAAIEAAASSEAAELERRLVAEAGRQARADAARRVATARLAAVREIRDGREDTFLELREQLTRELAGARDDTGYPELLGALIAEALAALPDATRLSIDARDAHLAAAHLPEQSTIFLDTTLQTWGGAIATSDSGRRVVNTLEQRLADAEPSMRLLHGQALAGARP